MMVEYNEVIKMYKKFYILIVLLLLVACSNNIKDAMKFKQEYEKYNKEKIELNISDKNIIEYKTTEEINKIIKEGTGIIFIGNPKDNASRESIKLLLDASESTDLDKIYYIDSLKGIKLNEINNPKIPIVLFVLDGKIIDININEKEELTEDESIDLYNEYLEKIHNVLQDTCDEEC